MSSKSGGFPRRPAVDPAGSLAYFDDMSMLDIVILPDSLLRKASAPVDAVDGGVLRLLDDMLETMYEAPGIGLAAVQVGRLARAITIDVSREGEPRDPLFLINPEITWRSDDLSSYQEGCLSIPEYYEEVVRPAKVGVRFLDRKGEQRELLAEGLLATCIQHEVDHLNGVLFIDYLSKLKRDRVMKKFQKQAKLKQAGQPSHTL
jgi:peptide deformylase